MTNNENSHKREERLKKATEFQEKGEWYYPCPDEWLKKKEWSVLSAMMLFAGINPRYSSEAKWAEFAKIWELTEMERLGREFEGSNFSLLSRDHLEKQLRHIREDAENRRKDVFKESGQLFSIKQCRDNEAHDSCRRFLLHYDESETLLNIFIERWLEVKGLTFSEFEKVRTQRFSKGTFLKWVVKEDLVKQIPWWEEAVSEGYCEIDCHSAMLTADHTTTKQTEISSQRQLAEEVEHRQKAQKPHTTKRGRPKKPIATTQLVQDLCKNHIKRSCPQKDIVNNVFERLKNRDHFKYGIEIESAEQKTQGPVVYRNSEGERKTLSKEAVRKIITRHISDKN